MAPLSPQSWLYLLGASLVTDAALFVHESVNELRNGGESAVEVALQLTTYVWPASR